MAKKTYKKTNDMTVEILETKTTTITESELEQKKIGLEEEIATLQAALAEVNEQLAVLG